MNEIRTKSAICTLERSSDRYVCTLCPENTGLSSENITLELHCRYEHPNDSHITCIYCQRLVSVTSIEKHIDRHFGSSDQSPYNCPLCPASYNNQLPLAHHAFVVHPSVASMVFYKCTHCDKRMLSPSDLSEHLYSSCITLYHCTYPQCLVKSPSRIPVMEHCSKTHGMDSPCIFSTRLFACSLRSEIRSEEAVPQAMNSQYNLYCPTCPFGTIKLDTFAKHLTSCRQSSTDIGSRSTLSVTCTLNKCVKCGWTSTAKNMLREHILETHEGLTDDDGIITEDFTVPCPDATNSYNVPPVCSDSLDPMSTNNLDLMSAITSRLNEFSQMFYTANMSALVNSDLSDITKGNTVKDNAPTNGSSFPLNLSLCSGSDPMEESSRLGHRSDTRPEQTQITDDSTNVPLGRRSNVPRSMVASNPNSREFVRLCFDEPLFVNAFTRNDRLKTFKSELPAIVSKLRQFATYKVPILGRANQRRVAGCPECGKQFNHGFTDLKKHLLITHFNIRRDIARFALPFTLPSKTQTDKRFTIAHGPSSMSTKQHLLRLRLKRVKKSNHDMSSFNCQSQSPKVVASSEYSTIPSSLERTSGLATINSDSTALAYSGGAPVHRVIPGTGVGEHYEDLKTLDEVSKEAPKHRGGIIPSDSSGHPIGDIDTLSNSDHANHERYLPKLGHQSIQLSYSFTVFSRLLETFQVPMSERIQLVNRMNHYARLYVIMESLGPVGAQKRFSCPACMYTSVHSLADIRKHIMGSHCGISTKRFRLCLRASRHDTVTYQLHSNERMIRFVEEHQRRKLKLSDHQSTACSSTPSTIESEFGETSIPVQPRRLPKMVNKRMRHSYSNVYAKSYNKSNLTVRQRLRDGQPRQLGKQKPSIVIKQYMGDVSDDLEDRYEENHTQNGNLQNTSSPTIPLDKEKATAGKVYGVETNSLTGETECHISLPFSVSVLRILLEREDLAGQWEDILSKMHIYSTYQVTVISRKDRIIAYICTCGRRFSVVREEKQSENRPASLADCRRHILGVHARIPAELLTLCCQCSRISRESGYTLYTDSSLLALAEQHKFRRDRVHNSTDALHGVPSSSSTLNLRGNDNNHKEVDLPPLQKLCSSDQSVPRFVNPDRMYESENFSPHQSHSVASTDRLFNSAVVAEPNNSTDAITAVGAVHKLEAPSLNNKAFDQPAYLDLDPPNHLLTSEEASAWSCRLSLPNTWELRRIVRLTYDVNMFEEQMQHVLSDKPTFVESLHERMRQYSRHSVYIAQTKKPVSGTPAVQRIYVCCACLTTSQHGFGDVRKHILGVHGHVPERFKTIAMNCSRLSRDDYSLNTSTEPRSSAAATGVKANIGPRVSMRRPKHPNTSANGRSNRKRPRAPCSHCPDDDDEERQWATDLWDAEVINTTSIHPRNEATGEHSFNVHSPRLTSTVLSKVNQRSAKSSISHSSPPFSSVTDTIASPIGNMSVENSLETPIISRSRRSMILKSKRPCPTSS